jgi:hypothetical protein
VSSGKRAKGRRPAPPPRRQASPRILLAAGVITALLAIAFVVTVKLVNGSSDPKPPPATGVARRVPMTSRACSGHHGEWRRAGQALPGAGQLSRVLFQSPTPAVETQVMPTVIQRYVRSGKLKVEARVLAFIGPDSLRGQSAAIAAGQQDKEFNFTQLLYVNQAGENSGWLSDEMVRSAAFSIPAGQGNLGRKRPPRTRPRRSSTSHRRRPTSQRTPTVLVGQAGACETVGLAATDPGRCRRDRRRAR